MSPSAVGVAKLAVADPGSLPGDVRVDGDDVERAL